MEAVGKMPKALMRGWTCAIPKESNTATPEGIRPITILSLLHRTWAGIRYQHLQQWIECTLADGQSAYRKGRSTKLELHSMLDLINKRADSNRPAFVAQLDLAKAFPKLNKEKACTVASLAGMPSTLVQYIMRASLSLSSTANGRSMVYSPRSAPCSGHQSRGEQASEQGWASKVFVYADDIRCLVFCSVEIMSYTVDMLLSLDLEINVLTSSVSMVGTFEVPRVILAQQNVPIVSNPNLFGSTLATFFQAPCRPMRSRIIPTHVPSTDGRRLRIAWKGLPD
eukprot:4705380-Amphidinium_carterae.1